MKRVAAAVLCAAAVAPGGFAVKTATAVAEARAQAWLTAHGTPQQDELAELKTENPEAYAIVKALLTKRSLGLLDPHHPSASFAAPPPKQDDDNEPHGAAAFEKIAEESGEKPKIAPLYAEAPTSSHHDWLNWKPQQSAVDEDAMVQNVLGAVAQMTSSGRASGGSLRGSVATEDDSAARGASLAWEAPAAPQAQPVVAVAPPAVQAVVSAPEPPKASMSQENSYLKGIDLGVADSVQPAPVKDNSYLKGLDLGGSDALAPTAPAPQTPSAPVVGLSAVKMEDPSNALASFSWDDNAGLSRTQPAQAAPSGQAPAESSSAPAAPAAGAKGSALMAWLTGSKPAQKQTAPPPAKPAPAGNAYLTDLA